MTIKNTLILLLCLSYLAGCKKDPRVYTRASTIIVGDKSEDMEVVTFDKPILLTADIKSYVSHKLNVNNDNQNDFLIRSEYEASQGGTRIISAFIMPVDLTIKIAVRDRIDSIFLCSPFEPDSMNFGTLYTKNSGYFCDSDNKRELIQVLNKPYPIIYSKGELVNTKEEWKSELFYLSYSDQSFSQLPPHQQNSILLGNWDPTELKYIVFKIERGYQTRYGWILISLDNYNHIQLHEYAIQK